jgi:hypothetical protein
VKTRSKRRQIFFLVTLVWPEAASQNQPNQSAPDAHRGKTALAWHSLNANSRLPTWPIPPQTHPHCATRLFVPSYFGGRISATNQGMYKQCVLPILRQRNNYVNSKLTIAAGTCMALKSALKYHSPLKVSEWQKVHWELCWLHHYKLPASSSTLSTRSVGVPSTQREKLASLAIRCH